MIARWLRALAAVLAGNALYFLVVAPRLPLAWRHRPFAIDAGLAIDFVICLALYILFERLLVGRARR